MKLNQIRVNNVNCNTRFHSSTCAYLCLVLDIVNYLHTSSITETINAAGKNLENGDNEGAYQETVHVTYAEIVRTALSSVSVASARRILQSLDQSKDDCRMAMMAP